MLILTRWVGETVMIGNDVAVTVLGVRGNLVRVGIDAPKAVAVHRKEIYERIKGEQRELALEPKQADLVEPRAARLGAVIDMSESLCGLVRIAQAMRTPVRQAFTLHKVYGLGCAQIAAQMNIPENMVSDYLVEALLHVASSTRIAPARDGSACTDSDSAGDHVSA